MSDTTSKADQLPPHSLEAERGAIGCCFLAKEAIDDVAELPPTAFYDVRYRTLFEIITELRKDGKPPNPRQVADGHAVAHYRMHEASMIAPPYQLAPQAPTVEETKLPVTFRNDGYTLRLVEREGDFAIYEQLNRNGRPICFEVVRIVHAPARRLPNGKVVDPCEQYPAPSKWGKLAWSCVTLKSARERLAIAREAAQNATTLRLLPLQRVNTAVHRRKGQCCPT